MLAQPGGPARDRRSCGYHPGVDGQGGRAAGERPPPRWRPEGVDAGWLTAALRHAGVLVAGRVAEVSVAPVGTGQMADCFRLTPVYDGAAAPDGGAPPASLVGKFTAASETSRATSVALRTAEAEVRFYQQVAPTLAVRTPACHYAEVDPATAEFVLLLEDLAPARTGDQLAGCGVDEAALALDELARLHAGRWGDPALERLSWLNRSDPAGDAMAAEVLPALFAGFCDRYGGQLEDEVLEVGRRLYARIGDYLAAPHGPRTVQHADYRLDNLLFGDGGGGPFVAVVDWQTVTCGPGAADASYFLGAGLPVEDRRREEFALLRTYHQALRAGGVAGYGWDECVRDYRRFAYAGYVMAVSASMLVERTERGDQMFLTMARRHAAQVVDLDAESLLGVGAGG